MPVTIATETPLSDDVRAMIGELNAVLLSLTPPDVCYHMSAEEMAGPDTTVFVGRVDGAAAAMGALLRHPDGTGEVKRMYTRPAFQGNGLGRKILSEIIALARSERCSRLVLETGTNYDAARHLYQSAGFSECGPVLGYPASDYSLFYQKPLQAEDETFS